MTESAQPIAPLEPETLRRLIKGDAALVVIDVRSPTEFASRHVEGAINIPADQLTARAGELPKDAMVVTVCNHGGARSRGAAEQLRALGFQNASPLGGGIHGWRDNDA